MIRISFIALVSLICICITIYTIWTLQVSRKKSNDLLTEFRKIDRSLQRSNDSLQKTTGAFRRDSFRFPEVELAIKVRAITSCIDSMKHDLVLLSTQKEAIPFTYPDEPRLLRLKDNLAGYNLFILKHFSDKPNIKRNDFVNIVDVPDGTSSVPWEIYYFRNTSILSVLRELWVVNTQVLKLQHKATK